MACRSLALALLLAAPLGAADWLQEGGDAARTGVFSGPGPSWDDVAWRTSIDLPAHMASNLVVVDGWIYLSPRAAVVRAPGSANPTEVETLVRVRLDDGSRQSFAPVPHPVTGLASDGHLLFASGAGTMTALRLSDGNIEWGPKPIADLQSARLGLPENNLLDQAPPVVAGDLVVAADLDSTLPMDAGLVMAGFDRTTGVRRWTWSAYDDTSRIEGVQPTTPETQRLQDLEPAAPTDFFEVHLSVVGPFAYAAVDSSFGTTKEEHGASLFAIRLDGTEGRLLRSITPASSPQGLGSNLFPAPTGDGNLVFAKFNSICQAKASDPAPLGSYEQEARCVPIRGATTDQGDLGAGFAYDGNLLYAAGARQVFQFDTEFSRGWTVDLPPGEIAESQGLAIGGGLVYVLSTTAPTRSVGLPHQLYALDAGQGHEVWSHAFPGRPFWAMADDLLVALDLSTSELVAVGTTPGSPHVVLQGVAGYPKHSQVVRVDLSGSLAGQDGPITEARVEWGDGSSTGWSDRVVLEHAFGLAGDVQTRFFVRNAAGQTASVPVTFHVDGKDPEETLVNAPFSDAYQNTSFFVLGLVATAAVGLFGIARAGRKRRLFHRELRALEDDHKRLQEDAKACDAMLAERKTRARGFFLERRLEEAHTSFLVGRVDELRKGLRLGTVESRLKFLPYGMVLHLQRVLQDARVDEYERSHFLAALEQEKTLSTAQRSEVAQLIDEWFTRDEGRPA